MATSMSSHLLVFPYPAQGHMLPLLDLTHHLATHGLTITILVTPKNLPILNPLLSTSPNIHPLVLPFPPHPSLPHGVENVKDIGNHGNPAIISALAHLQDPITEWFKSHPNPPVAILSDFFLGWTQNLAHKLGIYRICFFSSGAFLISVNEFACRNLSLIGSQGVTVFRDLPGSPSFSWEHLPTLVRMYKKSNPESKFMIDCYLANAESWGWVVNTFDALESRYIEYLTKLMGPERVFTVGPVNLISRSDHGQSDQSNQSDKSDPGSDFDVIRWLDRRPDGSVVYVCFGSQKFLTTYQMEGLAVGLEDSGVDYVWVVKPEQGGLVRAESDRGFVIKGWAPQVAILSHRAVGGFLSHCGWNSVLESILVGVMILAWPMEADQYVNARLLVEDHGAAVRVCEGPDTVPNSAELARTIAESMSGERIEKSKAKELKNKAIEAVGEGGRSLMELSRLVKVLASLQATK